MKREEAIHIVKTTKDWSELREALAVLVPELAESEDERIRIEMIKYFTEIKSTVPIGSPNHFDRYIAFLEKQEQKPISSCDIVPYIDDKIAALQDMWRKEKVAFDWDDMHEMIEDVARHFYQKEQKPAEWSDKDKNIFNLALDLIKHSDDCDGILDKELAVKWFAELPSRFVSQPKKEWSEEEELNTCPHYSDGYGCDISPMKKCESCEHRPSWKPSEEQIDALLYAMSFVSPSKKESVTLSELYDRLKELK